MPFTLTPQVIQALAIWAHSNNASMHWPSPHDEALVRSQTPIGGTPHPDVVLALLARLANLEAENTTYGKAVDTLTSRVEAMNAEEARLKRNTREAQDEVTRVTLERNALEQHIPELEKSLENVRDERNHLETQVAAASRQCEGLRTERDQHQQSAEVWRKRMEAAAEALADVLPGEVGRLDLIARIQALKDALSAAQQMLARLKPSGQVAEDEELVRECFDHYKPNGQPALLALHTLAAKAQGYEATVAELEAGKKLMAEHMRQRDAAVADNAALVEHARTERQMLALLYHRIKALGVHDATDTMTDAVTTVERWMDAVPDTYEQPHPGAALLERMKKLEETCRRLSNFRCDNEKQSDPDPTKPNCGACVVCEARLALAPH